MCNSENKQLLKSCAQRIYNELGEKGYEVVLNIVVSELGGVRLTIPSFSEIQRYIRNEKIKNSFTGDNIQELALRWGLSERRVRYILNKI